MAALQNVMAGLRAGGLRLSDPPQDSMRKIITRGAMLTQRFTKGRSIIARAARGVRHRWRKSVATSATEGPAGQDLRSLYLLTKVKGLSKLGTFNSGKSAADLPEPDSWFRANDLCIYVTESYLMKDLCPPSVLHSVLSARPMGSHGTDVTQDQFLSVGLQRERRRGTMLGHCWDALYNTSTTNSAANISDKDSNVGKSIYFTADNLTKSAPVWQAEKLWRQRAGRLLVGKSDVRATDNWDRTGLHMAAAMGDLELVGETFFRDRIICSHKSRLYIYIFFFDLIFLY